MMVGLTRSAGPLLLLILHLGGCATSAGVSEFVAYRDAFQASKDSAGALLDVVAVGERRARTQRAAVENPSGVFRIEDAATYATNVDPPTVRELRRAIAAVTSYNTVMVGLATGETATSFSAELAALGRDSLALAATVGASTTLATAAVPAAQKLAEIALRAQTYQLFRNELLDSSPAVVEVIEALRDAGPTLFAFLNLEDPSLRGDLAARRQRREQHRRLVSDWVVLWDSNLRALGQARAAAARPSTAGQLLALRNAVSGVNEAATAVREGLASLASK